MFRSEYDADADALYLRLGTGRVARTDEVDPGTLVDLDLDGHILGIEVIHPARQWPLGQVLARYVVADDDRDLLVALFPKPGHGLVSFPPRGQQVGTRQRGVLVPL